MSRDFKSYGAELRTSGASGRIDGIDVLRGLSIIAVLLLHINLRLPINKTFGQHWSPSIVNDIGRNGHNGVLVFFAISGFLITTMCLRRWQSLDGISLQRFYQLRFARIAPMLLALLFVLSVLHLCRVPDFTIRPEVSNLPRALFAALTFHVNWLEATHGYLPANWDVLWSLSNEEVFYLFFPLICILTRRRALLIPALSIFVALGPLARTLLSQNPMWQEKGYLSCMDAIAIGCIAAMISQSVKLSPRLRSAILCAGAMLAIFMTMFRTVVLRLGIYRVGLDVTLLSLGIALMCIAFAQAKKTGRMEWACLRWFGRNSYEVYLTHMMVILPAVPILGRIDPTSRAAPFSYVVMIFASGAVGAVIARYFSEPLNRYFRRSSASAPATPVAIEIPVAE
ncbi:MAG TPA: acyltransferase [Candidatus Acidoferrales bacterium]|nr:acyltransferase [Candidatus Acidoferrales bacterium]